MNTPTTTDKPTPEQVIARNKIRFQMAEMCPDFMSGSFMAAAQDAIDMAQRVIDVEEAKESGELSDGYHTFNELYEHRYALFMALQKFLPVQSFKSKRHADGSMFDGQFIAGTILYGGYIEYHLPLRLWDVCPANEYEYAPEWDGHTSNDVIKRLHGFISRKLNVVKMPDFSEALNPTEGA